MGVLKRYGELLPITPSTPQVNLEEGSTPLIPLPRIGDRLGVKLYGKFEGCNPSGSFKDRGMVLAVAPADVAAVTRALAEAGEQVFEIGEVRTRQPGEAAAVVA